MSDSSVKLNLGTGGPDVATFEDASNIEHQKALAEFMVGSVPTKISATDPMPVTESLGLISTANSSTAVLGPGAVYTGASEDVTQFAIITVFTYSDVNSSVDGGRLELSVDGTNWDRARTFTLEGGKSEVHTLAVVSQYFRVVYTNGSTVQGEFRVQTRYHRTQSKHLTSGIEQIIDKHDDVVLYRVVNDPRLDIARNKWSDKRVNHKFGSNQDIGTTEEDIWYSGGNYPWPLVAETIRVRVGGNVADDSGGVGAQKVVVEGLDTNFSEISEELTLAGASASAVSTLLFRRINRAYVSAVGAYTGTNAGDIIVENTTSTNILADLQSGIGQTQLSMFTVPSNHKAYLTRVHVNVDGSKAADIRMWQRDSAGDTSTPFSAKRLVIASDGLIGQYTLEFDSYREFDAQTDIWFSGMVATGSTKADVNYDLLLVDESL